MALNAYIKKYRFGKGWERLPLVGLGKGMVYWLGKVRLGKFKLVLIAI